MAQKIFIHVGAGKTGTSALQSFFAANRERLAKQGVVFPDTGLVSINKGLQHHPLSDQGQYANPDALRQWREIGRIDAPVLIVSSEIFHSKIDDAGGMAFFLTVREALRNKDIRIVFYLRRQVQWLQSAYSQWVKFNLQSRTFSDFVKEYKKSQLDQIFSFATVFGTENVIVRPFERAQFEGGTIERDFVALAGLRWDDDFALPEGNSNPRLTMDALELKRMVNQFAETSDELSVLTRDLLKYSASVSEDSRTLFHQHEMMDRAGQVRYEQSLEPRYRRIAKTFLGREDGVLFRDGFCDAKPAEPRAAGEQNAAATLDQVVAFVLLQAYRRQRAPENRLRALEAKAE